MDCAKEMPAIVQKKHAGLFENRGTVIESFRSARNQSRSFLPMRIRGAENRGACLCLKVAPQGSNVSAGVIEAEGTGRSNAAMAIKDRKPGYESPRAYPARWR